jgi:UDP-N-acetylglucosamine 2-epimerase (non-hydrolysing)
MIAVLVGTRPEIIKMAPILRKLEAKGLPHLFIHSNQHYSKEMDAEIIADLQLRPPDYHLHVGSASHAVQTGKIMEGVETILLNKKPSILLVHGDTNTTLAGALTAKKLHLPVAHIEAGLRSHDYRMPEEINRVLTDRISDILFAPTKEAKMNLKREGIKGKAIIVTGNTVVDALHEHLPLAMELPTIPALKKSDTFILVTLHRAENVDEAARLKSMIAVIKHAQRSLGIKVVFPIHPRTEQRLLEFSVSVPKSWIVIKPVGYITMLNLMVQAQLVLTDSGGIQEEAYILKKPLMTLRTSTERPETLTANFIIDSSIDSFNSAWKAYQKKKVSWTPAFGNGTASKKIITALKPYC